MKRALLLILCIVILLLATACSTQHYNNIDGNEMYFGLVLIRHRDENVHICYDPSTNVCYMVVYNEKTRGRSICPYYILENNKAVVAVYGVNYN